jgi:RNA polymerase sigma-70 factor (ECF subfamily)
VRTATAPTPDIGHSALEANRPWLTAYFLAALGEPTAAEDLVQEVFAAALSVEHRFDPSRSLGAWLRGIARNLLLRSLRDARRPPLSLDERVLDELDAAAEQAERRCDGAGAADDRLEALRDCLRLLPERSQRALQARYGRAESSRAIAEALGCSIPAVDMLISRARSALHRCISRKSGEAFDG